MLQIQQLNAQKHLGVHMLTQSALTLQGAQHMSRLPFPIVKLFPTYASQMEQLVMMFWNVMNMKHKLHVKETQV